MPVLVAGSPCGGKSRFAKESATSGQLVLDFDALMEVERPAAWAEYVRTWFRQFESSSRPGAESYVWTDR